jgi:3-hydroxyacyl-CoA dehydrogenase/3a,7a,12a-trihydroxy-5b-cholest-24-enoyl-CoA hydratase
VGRAVIEGFCGNDPKKFRSIKVRFAAPVMPGETIITDMWKTSPTEVVCSARVKERDVEVVKNAKVTIAA